ncbi:MAG: thioredoxin [Bacteroidales bacterium]|nr:thioredoxin [Bacteroidales bacterium]
MIVEVNDSNFEEVVLKSEKLVIIDFWAEWCGPCRMVDPIIKEISEEYAGRVLAAKVDVDSNPGISSKLGIRNIPTVMFFMDGEMVDKQVGAVPKSYFVSKLEPLL